MLALCEAYQCADMLYSLTEASEEVRLSSQFAGQLAEDTVADWTLQLVQAILHCHQQGELSYMHGICGTVVVCLVVVCLQVHTYVCTQLPAQKRCLLQELFIAR